MRAQDFYTPKKTYLLSHSIGLQLKSSAAVAQKNFFQPWQNASDQTWPSWLEVIQDFNQALADLLNSNAKNFCPQTNLSSGFSKILQALTFRPKRKTILVHEHDFPSMVFVAEKAKKLGLTLRFIPATMNVQDIDEWQQYLDDDVALVVLTHAYSNTAQLLDINAITKICKEKEIISVVDVAQSVGIIPIDLSLWQADFVLGSCVKWLCGGPGAGFLWVNDNILPHTKPIDVGWFSHENPFEFDSHNFRYHSSAFKFWGGTPSILPYSVATNSIRYFINLGKDTAYKHNQKLLQIVIDNIPPDWLISPLVSVQRSGAMVIKCPNTKNNYKNHNKFLSELTNSGIIYDQRSFGVRISPHIYNDANDIKKLVSCVQSV